MALSFSVTTCSDGPERLDPSRGARWMVAVDPRPETQVRAMAHAVWAQPVSHPGAREATSQAMFVEWSFS